MNQPWSPSFPTGKGQEGQDMQDLIDAQARTIGNQAALINYYQSYLNLMPDDDGSGGSQPPWYLWGGPYPLQVGPISPLNVKIWFNTTTNQLMFWNWQTQQWMPAPTTVTSGATPPNPTGSLYVDPTGKLWMKLDDLRELTAAVGAPTVPNNANFVASLTPPQAPATGSLWFEPRFQNLNMWVSGSWTLIGNRVQRNVRNGNYLNSWNAGGNRAQAIAAGDILWVAGIRGIDPTTQLQVPGCGPQNTQGTNAPNTAPNANGRIDQIYTNIKTIATAEGLTLFDCLMIHTALVSNAYISPTAGQQALPQFWGLGPYPNRTHEVWISMSGSDPEQEFGATVPGWPARGDVVECTCTFYTGKPGKRFPSMLASEVKAIPGVKVGEGLPPLIGARR